eukprot:TRINITY_DN1516_c0_g1_i1.p1 TRINITY_DN1516_c0_g1~~TRINITY_DN1516_c0_g1_i1.p1  ORF type:complete len:541 (-),score=54.84 TRINITY_DN1516_c0_g1_i1:737-2359(-)
MEPSPLPIDSIRLHDRIRTVDGRHGRIAYKGTLPGRPDSQTFLGIEYDLPNQGKHDGTFQNVRLFGPTKHIAAGSFLPTDQMVLFASPSQSSSPSTSSSTNFQLFIGISLEEAIVRKYGEPVEVESNPISFGSKQVEMILSQRDLMSTSKTIFSVPGEYVVSCTVSSLPQSWTESILHLDLSDNMIWNWPHLSESLNATFPSLTLLNLSQNPLKAAAEWPLNGASSRFNHLKTLVLNRCIDMDWELVSTIMSTTMHVEELHLSGNGLKTPLNTDKLIPALSSLSEISLSDNSFYTWVEIEWLGRLPLLKRLVLNSCGLQRIVCRPDPNLFPVLTHLSLSDNPIASWKDIAELNNIHSVADLRLQRCEFLKDTPQPLARLLVISIVPGLQTLNGSAVSSKERTDGERTLLSRLKMMPAELEQSLPFLPLLRTKHPDITDADHPGSQNQSAGMDTLMEVELRSAFGGSAVLSLPLTLTLPKLIALFKRTFSDMDSSFQLFWCSNNEGLERIPIEQLSLTLAEIIPSWLTYSSSNKIRIEARI